MPTVDLAAGTIALHAQALTANTAQTVNVKGLGQDPRIGGATVRLFNTGTDAIYLRLGSTVAVADPLAYFLPGGSVVDLVLEDAPTAVVSLISASAGSFTLERRPPGDTYRAGAQSAASGGGGGGTASSVKVWDGTTSAAVKGANTPAAAGDAALVVTQSPNAPATRIAGGDGVAVVAAANPVPAVVGDAAGNQVGTATATPASNARGLLVRTIPGTTPSPFDLRQLLGTDIGTANPLPTRPLGRDGASFASDSNPLPVRTASSSNSTPSYEKGAYVLASDDLAQTSTATSTNIAAVDASDLRSVSVQVDILSNYSISSLVFQVSNTGVLWTNKQLVQVNNGQSSQGLGALANAGAGQYGVYQGDIGARYFRVLQSGWTAGQARVTAVFSALSTATVPQQAVALLAGSQSIGSVVVSSGSLATRQEGASLSALNATAGGAAELNDLSQIQLSVVGTWSGTLIFEVTNDYTNWYPKALIPSALGASATTTTVNGLWFGHLGARAFRVRMSAYTSGTAVVNARYNSATGEMPISTVTSQTRQAANADAVAGSGLDMIVVAAQTDNNNMSRLRNASGVATQTAPGLSLSVAGGGPVFSSISAAGAPVPGTALDGSVVRAAHTLQVDATTTAAGTAGAHTVVLEGSLDNTYFYPIGQVTLASTSTTAADASNHAAVSAAAQPWRYVRARWSTIPTGWTGTLTARVASV